MVGGRQEMKVVWGGWRRGIGMGGRRNEPQLAAPGVCNPLRTIQNAKAPLQMLVGTLSTFHPPKLPQFVWG